MTTHKDPRLNKKLDARCGIQSEYVERTKEGVLILGALLSLQWIYGIYMDNSYVRQDVTLWLLGLILLTSLSFSHSPINSPFRNGFIAYAVLLALELSSAPLTYNLRAGTFLLIFSAAYFLLVTICLCKQYPFNTNMIGCAVLAIAPQAFGPLVTQNFNHLAYAICVYSVLGMVIMAHYEFRQKIVLCFALQKPRSAAPSEKSHDIYEIKQWYDDLSAKSGSAASNASLIRLSIGADETAQPAYYDEAAQQKTLAILRQSLRKEDAATLISKYDFICILADTSKDIADIIAGRMLDKIRSEILTAAQAAPGLGESCRIHIACSPFNIKESFEKMLARTAYKPKRKCAPDASLETDKPAQQEAARSPKRKRAPAASIDIDKAAEREAARSQYQPIMRQRPVALAKRVA